MKKIDIHCHTTNRKLEDVAEGATLDVIARKMWGYDIEKTVLLATYFPHKTSGISNYRMLHWIKKAKKEGMDGFCMFGSLDFEFYFYQGLNELEELAYEGNIKGIKIYTSYQNVDLKSDNFKKVADVASKYSLPIMFHAGYSFSTMRKLGREAVTVIAKASDIEPVARANPNINIILSHMAKPDYNGLIEVMKRNNNIYTDMSGMIDSKRDRDQIPAIVEAITRVLYECGPKKVMFGTDFPVQTYEDSMFFIERAMRNFSEKDKEDVYYSNAAKILQL